MSALNLLWIVPLAMICGCVVAGLCAMSRDTWYREEIARLRMLLAAQAPGRE